MHDYDAIIIGSGAGGLTAAASLARAGQRVAVFERHYLPGGWCHSFALGGHKFTKDPLLRAILTIQAGDHGVGPKRAVTAIHASVASSVR